MLESKRSLGMRNECRLVMCIHLVDLTWFVRLCGSSLQSQCRRSSKKRLRAKSPHRHDSDSESVSQDDIPSDVVTVTITVLSKGKRGKDSEVAELIVGLCGLKNGQETEEWYPLIGMTPMGEWGSIRLSIRDLDALVMPCDEYWSRRSVSGMEKRNDPDGSLHACRVHHLSAVGRVRHNPKKLESKLSEELNPTKMDENAEACSNAEFLLMTLDQVTQFIFTSPDACPRTVRFICNCLQKSVVAQRTVSADPRVNHFALGVPRFS
ncbi:hypothetical protein quinque_013976 [Culex quinquefasciatus]